MEPREPPTLFSMPVPRAPLRGFRRRLTHHRPSGPPGDPLAAWAARHAGARGRSPSGTVHLTTDDWLPLCGAGLNGWDPRGLQPTDDEVTCGRCGGSSAGRHPGEGQLPLF
jgi:hypothetical protein